MSSAFSIALSSLQAQSEGINVAGNNLANINTTGFKGSNLDFRDLVAGTSGMGVAKPVAERVFSQGAITTSASPWAAAIQGSGFFMLQSPSGESLYTRDGDFTVSATGVLQTLSGEKVQGWTATQGTLNTNGIPGDIIVPTGQTSPPQATTNLTFTANLNAAGSASAGTNTLSVPASVVDSLGTTHTLTISFTKSTTAANSWAYDVTIPGQDLATGTTGVQTSILTSPGTLTFNANGTLTAASSAPIPLSVTGLANGASNLSIGWNPLNSNGTGAITQYAQLSSYDALKQNGLEAGTLNDVSIGAGGQILASFSNGQQKAVGQLALATFQNPGSLQSVGGNNYMTSGSTAAASIGVPQTGGRGDIVNGSLEGSNVDIGTQFTSLITYQRGYQASSKVITTEDNVLQDLLGLIR
jgi:flagellar hook protein FlgE